MTSKEKALIKAQSKIHVLEIELENLEKTLKLIVDEDSVKKCVDSHKEELKTWHYIAESIRLNKNENNLNF